MIQEAWLGGVSTRRVDDLVQAMGLAGISKSTVQRYLQAFNLKPHRVESFKLSTDRERPAVPSTCATARPPCSRP